MFKRLFAALASKPTKKHRPRKKDILSKEEYPESTTNMAEHGQGKQLPAEYDNSDTELSSIYKHTRTQTGTIPPINYVALNHGALHPGCKTSRPSSVLADSRTSSSIEEQEVTAYMANVPERNDLST